MARGCGSREERAARQHLSRPLSFLSPIACSDTFDLASHQLIAHLESGLVIAADGMRRLQRADVDESHPATAHAKLFGHAVIAAASAGGATQLALPRLSQRIDELRTLLAHEQQSKSSAKTAKFA